MNIAAYISAKDLNESYLFASLKIISNKNTVLKIIIFTEELPTYSLDKFTFIKISNKNKIALLYWKKITLPAYLSKAKATVFITTSHFYLSNKTAIKQYLFVSNNIINYKTKHSITALSNAHKIFTTEYFMTKALPPNAKVITVYRGLPQQSKNSLQSYNESVKTQFADGYDYILFNVNATNSKHLILVLKAYSLLKKWQKTSIKLLLLVKDLPLENLVPNFNTYKNKTDVFVVQQTVQNKIDIIAAAFLQIFLSEFSIINDAIIALQNNVPVIAHHNEVNESIFGTAAIYSKADELSLFEKMQIIYKDDFIKINLHHNALEQLSKYNYEVAADNLYQQLLD